MSMPFTVDELQEIVDEARDKERQKQLWKVITQEFSQAEISELTPGKVTDVLNEDKYKETRNLYPKKEEIPPDSVHSHFYDKVRSDLRYLRCRLEKNSERKALKNDIMEYYDEIVGDEQKREDFQEKIDKKLSLDESDLRDA